MEKLELLNFYNKWWLTDKVPQELYREFKRDIFTLIEYSIPYSYPSNRIISIIGLRRTGKTTILYQLIQSLLDEKINPKRILFLNISDPLIANKPESLEELLREYQKNVLREDFSKLREPVYVFFDEIQYLPQWELYLKRFIDLKFKVKFIITGSAGIKINKKSKESLVGRLDEWRIYPLSFIEFIKFKNFQSKKDKNTVKVVDPVNFKFKVTGYGRLSSGILRFLSLYQSYSSLGKKFLEKKTEIYGEQNFFQILLNEYVEKGGFPEIIDQESVDLAYRYLNQDVLDRILAQDITQIAQIRDPQLLQPLLIYSAQKTASTLSYDSLSKDTGARIETIRNYFLYLTSSFMVNIVNKFRKSEISKFRSKKKIYLADLGLRNSILKLDKRTILSEQYKGVNAETLVVNFLTSERRELSFWQKDDYEVDVIVKDLNYIVPLEVKFRKDIKREDVQGLIKFSQLYKTGGGIVITESKIDFQDNIVYIPLWLFLLIF